MTRITRTAGCALALVFLSLSAFTAANAEEQSYPKYGYCADFASRSETAVFSRVFELGPSGPIGTYSAPFLNAVEKIYGPLAKRGGCEFHATAAEAQARHRDEMERAASGYSVVVINWIPQDATALSAPVKEPAPAAAKPAAPAPVAAAAPAADTAVKYDLWGKPIPTTAWWVCESHLRKYLYVAAPFFGATNNQADNAIYQSFMDDLIKKYHEAGTASCNKFATQAEAQASVEQDSAKASGTGYQFQMIDWTYAPDAAKAAAPAPVKPATPAANAAVTPKPAPVAVAAKPASPAPAKPATAAAKPAVYVICRADWNPDLRRFYNPPVDGRGAGYPEWQASWHQYLVTHYKFRESNFGCSKYPTREEAQAGFEEWVVAARASPTVNGLPSPVIITNWKY